MNNDEAQEFERKWWATAANTFGEEAKQLTYANLIGLANEPRDGRWPVYDLKGRSVLDLGGGPVSMLLKTVNGRNLTVVDPCPYPDWVRARYEAAGIAWFLAPAEEWRAEEDDELWDEAWIYNCLQHVIDPRAVIATAQRKARKLRIFEWLETTTDVGHPHTIHASDLNAWLCASGNVQHVNENGAVGLVYYGVFDLTVRGTDRCGCEWKPGAEYPACPHDIRGHKGVEGAAGG